MARAPARQAEETSVEHARLVPVMVLLAPLAVLVVGQLYVSIPLVSPMAADWGVSARNVAAVTTVFGLSYATGFLVAGPLVDRYGPLPVLRVGLILTGVATAGVAAAGSLAAAVVLSGVQGLVAAGFAPSAFAYIAARIAPAHRPLALTMLTTAFFAGSIAGQAGAQVLAAFAGWRAVYVVSAVLFIGGAFGAVRVLRARPRGQSGSIAQAFAEMLTLVRRLRMVALYGATATLLCGFVTVYMGLELGGSVSEDVLLPLRLSALPALLVAPLCAPLLARFFAGRRAAAALAVAGCAALVAGMPGLDVVGLGVLLAVFVASLGCAAPALVQAITVLAGQARGAATAVYTFAMFVGGSAGAQLAGSAGAGRFDVMGLVAGGVLLAGAALALAASA